MWPASPGFLPQHHLLPPIPPSHPLPNYHAPQPPSSPQNVLSCPSIIIKQVDTTILSAEAKDDLCPKKANKLFDCCFANFLSITILWRCDVNHKVLHGDNLVTALLEHQTMKHGSSFVVGCLQKEEVYPQGFDQGLNNASMFGCCSSPGLRCAKAGCWPIHQSLLMLTGSLHKLSISTELCTQITRRYSKVMC